MEMVFKGEKKDGVLHMFVAGVPGIQCRQGKRAWPLKRTETLVVIKVGEGELGLKVPDRKLMGNE